MNRGLAVAYNVDNDTRQKAEVRSRAEPTRKGPGLHSKKPWEKVLSVSMMEQNLDLSGQDIADFYRNQIGSRYGVNFNAVDLTDILPPDELSPSAASTPGSCAPPMAR